MRISSKAVLRLKVFDATFALNYANIFGGFIIAVVHPILSTDPSAPSWIFSLTLSYDKENVARILTVIILSKSFGGVLMMLQRQVMAAA